MSPWRFSKRILFTCALLAVATPLPRPARAWGDEGHEIISLIAEHYLDPAAGAKVITLLATDTATLTAHDIASEATWADKYRNSDRDTTRVRYEGTRQWHFVDIEVAAPNLDAACFGHLPLPAGVLASEGPTITTRAGTGSLLPLKGSTPATFIASGIFSSSSAWGPTRVKSRPT